MHQGFSVMKDLVFLKFVDPTFKGILVYLISDASLQKDLVILQRSLLMVE